MRCYRFDLRRKYPRYIHGELKPTDAAKIDKHLASCALCNLLVAHLRDTDELLRNLNTGRASEETWRKIEAALPHHLPFESQIAGWKRIAAVIVFGLISGLLGAVTYGKINHNGLGIHP